MDPENEPVPVVGKPAAKPLPLVGEPSPEPLPLREEDVTVADRLDDRVSEDDQDWPAA